MTLAKNPKDLLPTRDAIEVDHHTKELGRQLLPRRLDDTHAASHHVDENTSESRSNPPREDRAG